MRFFQYRVALLSICSTVAVALSGCGGGNRRRSRKRLARRGPAAAPAMSQVERGKNLIIGGGCHDCHTPKKMGPKGVEFDMDLQLSGHPESDGVPPPFKNQRQPVSDSRQRSSDGVERSTGAYRLPRT